MRGSQKRGAPASPIVNSGCAVPKAGWHTSALVAQAHTFLAVRRYTVDALKHSPMMVRDPADADVILVNDYCYKLRWLAYVHAGGWLPAIQTEADEAEAGQTLLAVRAQQPEQPTT